LSFPFGQRAGRIICRGRKCRALQLARLQAVAARTYERVGNCSDRAWPRRPVSVVSTRSPACRSPSRATCATPILSDSSPARSRISSGCMPLAAPRASLSWWHTPKSDLDFWTSVYGADSRRRGLTRGDIIQNAYGYGLFTGGLGAHYGAEALGATVIPSPAGNTERQINGDEGFQSHRHLLHAELFSAPAGARRGNGRGRLLPTVAGRSFRRRAVDRFHAPPH